MLFTDAKDIKDMKKVFKNPVIIAVFIGLFLMLFSVKIPDVLLGSINMVGGLTTPISMLIIGSLLATTKFKLAIQDLTLYYGSIIKLLVIPVVMYFVAAIFHEKSIVFKCLILMQAMPAGDKTIQLNGSDGKSSVISSKGLNITLDFGSSDDTKPTNTDETDNDNHFSSKVSLDDLFKNSSIIEKKILNPVQKATEEVDDAKSIVYGDFIKEF